MRHDKYSNKIAGSDLVGSEYIVSSLIIYNIHNILHRQAASATGVHYTTYIHFLNTSDTIHHGSRINVHYLQRYLSSH